MGHLDKGPVLEERDDDGNIITESEYGVDASRLQQRLELLDSKLVGEPAACRLRRWTKGET